MATNPPSDASFPSGETLGPYGEYDEMERALGPGHPAMCPCDETLFYYDGPQCWIGRVAGDPRPRLNVVVDEARRGEAPLTTFTTRHHQFVFADEQVLRSTLCEGMAPTESSYRLADELIEWEITSSHVEHPEPRTLCRMRIITADDAGDDIMTSNEPEGLPMDGEKENHA